MKKLMILPLFLITTTFASNTFYNFYDKELEASVDSLLMGARETLKGKLPLPKETHITNRSYLSTQYDASTDTLNVADDLSATTLHEFAHQIFDFYLVDEVPIWKYFKVRNSIRYADLMTEISKEEKLLARYTVALENAMNAGDKRIINMAKKSIAKVEEKLSRLNSVKDFDTEYGPIVDSSNVFKRVTPYQEIFADIISVYVLEDWKAVYQAALTVTGDPVSSEYRDFLEGSTLELRYNDPYTFFVTLRSWIRSNHKSPREINLSCLSSSLSSVLEKDLLAKFTGDFEYRNQLVISEYSTCLKAE